MSVEHDMILIRPVRSTYIDKHGYVRNLKPNVSHGAWVVRGTRESLAYRRKYSDLVQNESELPQALIDFVMHHNRNEVYLSAAQLRDLGLSVPEIPTKGWGKWWFYFINDAGSYK
jgi:hypothetical protein